MTLRHRFPVVFETAPMQDTPVRVALITAAAAVLSVATVIVL